MEYKYVAPSSATLEERLIIDEANAMRDLGENQKADAFVVRAGQRMAERRAQELFLLRGLVAPE